MQSEECVKWVDNGLPRKGWKLYDVVDNEHTEEKCDWCGTSIRFVHILYRDDSDIKTNCGCMCAEKLTEDYVTSKGLEKALRSLAQKKLREKKSAEKREQTRRNLFYGQFKTSKNGNLYRKDDDGVITIFKYKEGYKLIVNNIYGKKVFHMSLHAASAAYDYLHYQLGKL